MLVNHDASKRELSTIFGEVLNTHHHDVILGVHGSAGPRVGSRLPAMRTNVVGETRAEHRATQPGPYSQNPSFTRAPQARKQSPRGRLATLTDLCKQCAAVSIHWWCTREPLQMYTPRNRRLTCQGHLPTSTSRPFTTLQETLV